MEDTLVINGIKYIKQSQVEEMEKNLENIKQIVSSALVDVNNLIGSQLDVEQHEEKSLILDNKSDKKESPSFVKNLKIRKGAAAPYKIDRMDDNGDFYSIHNRKFVFNIKDVLVVRKDFNINTTAKDIKALSESLSLTVTHVHRIIYNLEIGTFDEYIRTWLESANKINIKEHVRPVENNPQKRKEAGMYS